MKTLLALSTCLLLLGTVVVPQTARADTADANCEVRKDGDKQGGKSGPCTFGQRQGYIDIDLRNGDTISLSPASQANQYRDQKGNKVHRVSSGSRSQEFTWEGGKRVIVTWTGNSYDNRDYGNNGYGAGATGHGSGKERDDYQRGYRDGKAGRYDQYDHTQAYKDGVRAGESEAGNGRDNDYGNGGGHGNYTIENIGNGSFEVKWTSQDCIADYDRYGSSTGYTNCNGDMKRRSDEIARQRAR